MLPNPLESRQYLRESSLRFLRNPAGAWQHLGRAPESRRYLGEALLPCGRGKAVGVSWWCPGRFLAVSWWSRWGLLVVVVVLVGPFLIEGAQQQQR